MEAPSGGLFANDFLRASIVELDEWQALGEAPLDGIDRSLRETFERFPTAQNPNESQTEDDLIWPVLTCLGWTSSLRQQNLTARGVDDVPDGLLFADEAAKARANGFGEEWKRYECGLAVVESKRWLLSLDGRTGPAARTAPSTQMLRYLRRVDDLTRGGLRWGILTNGARWRLYWQGARSVSEEFCEIDLAAVLDLAGHNDGLFALGPAERRHWLKVFILLFRREAFVPDAGGRRGAHAALPPALHPVCRRPRAAARGRRTLRRLRPPQAGARRRAAAQGPQRRLLGRRRALLVRVRRPRRRHRSGRPFHRPAAVQRRPLQPRAHPAARPRPARRSGDGRRHRRALVRADARGPPLHQLPRPERAAARVDLRTPARTRTRPRRPGDRRPAERLRAQGVGQLLHPA